MRLDHIVIHTDPDKARMKALKDTIHPLGYPYEPDRGPGSYELKTSRINIGDGYLELVRLLRKNPRVWMPLWSQMYSEGARGAYCIFIEVEDVERTAVAIKKAGIRARGPAVLSYPGILGLLRAETPYFIYYMPNFPESPLHLALIQYKSPAAKQAAIAALTPNSLDYGVNGIRKVEVALPKLDESLDMLHKILGTLKVNAGDWWIMLEKARLIFRQSPDADTHVRVTTVTLDKDLAGKCFQIDNVEVVTGGG